MRWLLRAGFVAGVLAGAFVALTAAQEPGVVELDASPARLPFRTVPNSLPWHPYTGEFAPSIVLADLDHDGWDEAVVVVNSGFMALDLERETPGVLWQHNVPAEYGAPPRSVWLGPPADVTGDGRPDILATADRRGVRLPRLWVFDAARQRMVADVELPGGYTGAGEADGDLRWLCAGVLPPAATGGAPLAVLAGLADAGRGSLLALDPLSARVEWRLDLAGRPNPAAVALSDLDGDATPEIVVATTATLVAVDARAGRARWSRELDAAAGAWSRVADLDGDGATEVVYATDPGGERGRGRVGVLAGRMGTLLVEKTLASGALGVELLPQARHGLIYLGLRGGGVHRYRYDPGRLAVDRRAVSTRAARVVALVDALPGAREPALLALLAGGGGLLLDGALAPLCALDVPVASLASAHAQVWAAGPNTRFLYVDAAASRGYTFARNETWLAVLARRSRELPAEAALGVVGLLGAAGVALALGARRRAARARHGNPELWARLLRESQVASHGAVAVTRPLRDRLPSLLQALTEEADRSPAVVARAREAWQSLREIGAPRVRGILDLAAAVGVAPETIRPGREGLATAMGGLQRLFDAELPAGRITEELPRIRIAGEQVDACLRRIRARAEARFRADVRAALAQAISAREQELRRAGVALAVDAAGFEEGPVFAVMPPGDLLFILDNLVGNAVRAMSGDCVLHRDLSVSLVASDGLLDVVVADNGPGVAADRRDAIFAGGGARPGGGVGLARGRETARKWGGDLVLLDTPPGSGASFRLTVARASDREQGLAG